MDLYVTHAKLEALQPLVYPPINDVSLYFLAVMVLHSLAVYSWRYRRTPEAFYMSIGIENLAVWMLAIVIVTISPRLVTKLFWVKIELMSSIAIAPTFLLFAVYITKQKEVLIRSVRRGLFLLTPFLWLVLLTNDWHGWILRDIVWDGVIFGFIRGPLYWGIMFSAYLALVTILVLYIRQMIKTSGLLHWQVLMVLLLLAISVIGHFSWLSTKNAPISLIPLGFMFSLIWSVISFGLCIFNLQEIANDAVTREMHDSMIVIDVQGYIVELNPAARLLFGEKTSGLIGSEFSTAFAFLPVLVELAACRESKRAETCFNTDCCSGYYTIHIVPLKIWQRWNLGKAIVIRDISEQKIAQMKNLEQQKALSIMAERDRLGRELHDGYGQLWSYMNMQVEAARVLLNKQDTANTESLLGKLAGITQDIHVDIRESITGLKLAADSEHGVWQALEEHLRWFQENYGIDMELAISKEFATGLLAPTTEVQLLRIIQEALTNIRKHAGARHVKVLIQLVGDVADIRIEDDGRGFRLTDAAEKKSSFGLKIMAERAAEIRAEFQILSRPGAGTKVILQVPLYKGKEMPL
ncbi:MAG: histidine kinase N-terminal 7TM domain-containing protein [Veillonellales bacterium]